MEGKYKRHEDGVRNALLPEHQHSLWTGTVSSHNSIFTVGSFFYGNWMKLYPVLYRSVVLMFDQDTWKTQRT